REPTRTHTPVATDVASGIRSVMTRMPDGNTVCSTPGSATSTRGQGLTSAPAPRAASPAAAVTAATAVVPPSVAADDRLRTEVAELAADLRVEGVLERDVLALRAAGRTVAVTSRAARLVGGRRVVSDEAQRDLAVGVDVVHAHADLVAELEHVLDALHALAATELRDVEQPVASREDVD